MGNASAYYVMGLVHQEAAEFDAAVACESKSLLLDPDFKETYLVLSSCHLRLGRYSKALEVGRACLRRFDSPTAHFFVGQAIYHMAWDTMGNLAKDQALSKSEVAELCTEAANSLQISKEYAQTAWERT